MLRALLIGAAALTSVGTSAGAAQPSDILMDGVVARVVVVPENRSDVLVDVRGESAGLPQIRVRRVGARTVLEGGLETNRCSGEGPGRTVRIRGGRQLTMTEAPVVTIRGPRDMVITTRKGAVQGDVGRTQTLTISSGGCSSWRVADVAEGLQLRQSGGARAVAGRARTARLEASGGGSIQVGAVGDLQAGASGGGRLQVASVAGSMRADASGGGTIQVVTVGGPVTAEASGGGGISIAGGSSGTLEASASGGGWVDHGGTAAGLSAQASGGGRVKVGAVKGPIRQRSQSGGGRVVVGR